MQNIADQYALENYRVIEVSPETAAEWKKTNISNRPIARLRVNQYARDMQEGNWKFTADPIRFSKSDRLLDGQHRLEAIIAANVTLPMLVVFDLEE